MIYKNNGILCSVSLPCGTEGYLCSLTGVLPNLFHFSLAIYGISMLSDTKREVKP